MDVSHQLSDQPNPMLSTKLGQLYHAPSYEYLTPEVRLSLEVLESHSSLLHWPPLGENLIIPLMCLPIAKLGEIEPGKHMADLLGL